MTDIALSPQSYNDLLTLKEIADRLGVSYGRLRGFAETEGVPEFVGAVDVPGVKGLRYPKEAEEQFGRLVQAQDNGLVTPKTARAYLAGLTIEPLSQSSNDDAIRSNGTLSQKDNGLVYRQGGGLADILDRLVTVQERALPPPADRLVGREEAAQLLACHRSAVGRYVKPVRRDTWRYSDLQKYIARLQQL